MHQPQKGKTSLGNILIAGIAIAIILALAFLFYYFASRQMSLAFAGVSVVESSHKQVPVVQHGDTTITLPVPENVPPLRYEQKQICIANNCFASAVADSTDARERGLMFQASLDAGKGMWFVFDKSGTYAFWMKDTLLPLDIIWVTEANQIAFIQPSALPCIEGKACPAITPKAEAKYVLEINAGLAKKYGFKVGDVVTIK